MRPQFRKVSALESETRSHEFDDDGLTLIAGPDGLEAALLSQNAEAEMTCAEGEAVVAVDELASKLALEVQTSAVDELEQSLESSAEKVCRNVTIETPESLGATHLLHSRRTRTSASSCH